MADLIETTHEQQLFRADIMRNLSANPNGFSDIPRPVFTEGTEPNPVADALRTIDGVIADPVPGSRVQVLGPLMTRISPNNRLRVQFLEALGAPRKTDEIAPFSEVRIDDWTEVKSRMLRAYFSKIVVVEDVLLDEGRLKSAEYYVVTAPDKRPKKLDK